MRVLIPARGKSKRIPRKNLMPLGGKPLICWSIEAGLQLPSSGVVVSTEDEEIAKVARRYGAEVLIRPEELASDTATDHDVVSHFIEHYDCNSVLYLRPTTPFRKLKVLQQITSLEVFELYTSLRTLQPMPESAFKCFTKGGWDVAEPILHKGKNYADYPNQQCPVTYSANGYADVIFPKRWFDPENIFGERIYGFVTPPTIELDIPEQWAYAEYLIEKGLV